LLLLLLIEVITVPSSPPQPPPPSPTIVIINVCATYLLLKIIFQNLEQRTTKTEVVALNVIVNGITEKHFHKNSNRKYLLFLLGSVGNVSQKRCGVITDKTGTHVDRDDF
jgi:hypothetical protein